MLFNEKKELFAFLLIKIKKKNRNWKFLLIHNYEDAAVAFWEKKMLLQ